jgi:uncharacterized membrane protein
MENKVGTSINSHWERLSGYFHHESTPSNVALWVVLLFANGVFLLIDAVTGYAVYQGIGVWEYGVLAFLAGCVPLWIAEGAFVRAYASKWQKIIAGSSAALSIIEIVSSAGISAVLLTSVDTQDTTAFQFSLAAVIIGCVILQAILALAYFYIDEEIRENQKLKQGLAGIERTSRRADKVLQGLDMEKAVAAKENEIREKADGKDFTQRRTG